MNLNDKIKIGAEIFARKHHCNVQNVRANIKQMIWFAKHTDDKMIHVQSEENKGFVLLGLSVWGLDCQFMLLSDFCRDDDDMISYTEGIHSGKCGMVYLHTLLGGDEIISPCENNGLVYFESIAAVAHQDNAEAYATLNVIEFSVI